MALRNFESLQSPLAFELMAGLRETVCEVIAVAAALDDQWPIFFDERLRHERTDLFGGALAERFERVAIDDCMLLEGGVRSSGAIKLDRFETGLIGRADRNADRGGFHRVAVDLQIDRDGLMLPGQPREDKIFQPDAGMKHFGLMAGQKNRGGLGRHRNIAVAMREVQRLGEQLRGLRWRAR